MVPINFTLKKICYANFLSKNYFVFSNHLTKMSLYVSFSLQVTKMEFGRLYAFHKKPPRRSKIWNTPGGIKDWWTSWHPPPSPQVATPAKVLLLPQQKVWVTLKLFCSNKTFCKLILKKIIFERSSAKPQFF